MKLKINFNKDDNVNILVICCRIPNRTDYINIGNEAATKVTALESLAKNGNNDLTELLSITYTIKQKSRFKEDYTSEEKV